MTFATLDLIHELLIREKTAAEKEHYAAGRSEFLMLRYAPPFGPGRDENSPPCEKRQISEEDIRIANEKLDMARVRLDAVNDALAEFGSTDWCGLLQIKHEE